MDRNMKHLAEVVVRLQQESIRFRSIMENIPKEHRFGGTSDDVLYYRYGIRVYCRYYL